VTEYPFASVHESVHGTTRTFGDVHFWAARSHSGHPNDLGGFLI
jgi:hypothetical protein